MFLLFPYLQVRLLEAYLALPNANAFATGHEALSKLCASALRVSAPASIGPAASLLMLFFDIMYHLQ